MKISLTYLKNHLVCLGAAVLLLVSVSMAKAQILLTVDISNLNTTGIVTITASGTYTGDGASSTLNNGIDLLNIFTSDVGINQVAISGTSSLTTGAGDAGSAVFDTVYPDDYSSATLGQLGYTDLSLYSSNESAPETFSTGTSGFAGTISLDLSGYSLQSAGKGGDIIIGYAGTNTPGGGVVVGQYQIATAPEPSTWILLFLGGAVLAIRRFRPNNLGFKFAAQKK